MSHGTLAFGVWLLAACSEDPVAADNPTTPAYPADDGSAPVATSPDGGEVDAEISPIPGDDFNPDAVKSCATLGLSGTCVEVHNAAELTATQTTCPMRDFCRILIHPGTYDLDASVYTYHHWFRHYIGIRDSAGNRPTISSKIGSVFANKGSQERPLNTVLQNLILTGTVQGVDFDGATGAPYFSKGGLSWLDRVKVDADSREIFFNSGPNPGGGSFWCTRCELVHRSTPLNPNSMIAIGEIDSVWFSQSTFRSDKWNNATVGIAARSIGFDGVVDDRGSSFGCGSFQVTCRPGNMPHLLRAPTLAWFESLVMAQTH